MEEGQETDKYHESDDEDSCSSSIAGQANPRNHNNESIKRKQRRKDRNRNSNDAKNRPRKKSMPTRGLPPCLNPVCNKLHIILELTVTPQEDKLKLCKKYRNRKKREPKEGRSNGGKE